MKTCFKRVEYELSTLLHYIDVGDIGLPDIQRPFVWSNAKVRDLFDSMYRGFPVGYFLFWENSGASARQIGHDAKAHANPNRLIVDGQQRLTSLYAVFRGQAVLDDSYEHRRIEIAFRPRDGRFEVSDAAIKRNPEWIPDISALWTSGDSNYQIIKSFLSRRSASELAHEEQNAIEINLDHLFGLQKYPFTALEIAPDVDEEQVADIFVRINSEGVTLNQSDFLLTLLSVFWDEGRHELESFCRESRRAPHAKSAASPFNHFIKPSADQLLRVSVAFGFNRGRLKSVYQVLRGKDLDTGAYSASSRDKQFAVLKQAQSVVLNLTRWHQFMLALIGAGYRSGEMISSQNALLYAYAFYLIGRSRCGVPEHLLQRAIGRWFFFSSLTGRYTASPETVMDGDLNRLQNLATPDEFLNALNRLVGREFTPDYWAIRLPGELDSSSARNPQFFAYVAAQNLLGAPVLFSHKKVSELLDPAIKSSKKALERHHLFPRAWLQKRGITDLKLVNQVANFALIEWPENIAISDDDPRSYARELRVRFSADEWRIFHELHALPHDWQDMDYDSFLVERRKLMANVIMRGFGVLSAGLDFIAAPAETA